MSIISNDECQSLEFRRKCIYDIVETGWYKDLGNFLQRYYNGENFDTAKLRSLGYDYFQARNLAAYINHPHDDDYYSNALGWE